jgi:hypothetical protein
MSFQRPVHNYIVSPFYYKCEFSITEWSGNTEANKDNHYKGTNHPLQRSQKRYFRFTGMIPSVIIFCGRRQYHLPAQTETRNVKWRWIGHILYIPQTNTTRQHCFISQRKWKLERPRNRVVVVGGRGEEDIPDPYIFK